MVCFAQEPAMATRRRKGIAVAAIDFGTTYSGYAYTFNADYKDDHTKVTKMNTCHLLALL